MSDRPVLLTADVPAEAMRNLKRMYTESVGLADDLAAEAAIAHAYRADHDGIEGRRTRVQSRNRAQISREGR